MFSSTMKRKWYFSEIFHTQFCFDMFYTVRSLKVNFLMYGENTNTIAIQIP